MAIFQLISIWFLRQILLVLTNSNICMCILNRIWIFRYHCLFPLWCSLPANLLILRYLSLYIIGTHEISKQYSRIASTMPTDFENQKISGLLFFVNYKAVTGSKSEPVNKAICSTRSIWNALKMWYKLQFLYVISGVFEKASYTSL